MSASISIVKKKRQRVGLRLIRMFWLRGQQREMERWRPVFKKPVLVIDVLSAMCWLGGLVTRCRPLLAIYHSNPVKLPGRAARVLEQLFSPATILFCVQQDRLSSLGWLATHYLMLPLPCILMKGVFHIHTHTCSPPPLSSTHAITLRGDYRFTKQQYCEYLTKTQLSFASNLGEILRSLWAMSAFTRISATRPKHILTQVL